jgi:hypothetical protein
VLIPEIRGFFFFQNRAIILVIARQTFKQNYCQRQLHAVSSVIALQKPNLKR